LIREAPTDADIDPLYRMAGEMLDDAVLEIKKLNLDDADKILKHIQAMAPDYCPAYAERAKLYESRSMVQQALRQWQLLEEHGAKTSWAKHAAVEQKRLLEQTKSRNSVQILRTKAPKKKPKVRKANNADDNLPRAVRITSIKRKKFPAGDEFDEMRLVIIAMKPGKGTAGIPAGKVKVKVQFYDRDENGFLTPTEAVVPEEPLQVDKRWKAGTRHTITAAYVIPKGMRLEERNSTGHTMKYAGYIVSVYLNNTLQDRRAYPKNLPTTIASQPMQL